MTAVPAQPVPPADRGRAPRPYNALASRPGWKFYLPVVCGSLALFAFLVLPWITVVYVMGVTGISLAARTSLTGVFMNGFKEMVQGSTSSFYGGGDMSGAYRMMTAGFGLLWLVPAGALCSLFMLKRGRLAKILPVIGAAIGLVGLILYTVFTLSAVKSATAAFGESFLGGLLGDVGSTGLGMAGSLVSFTGIGYILAWIALAGQAAGCILAYKEIDQRNWYG